MKQFPQQILPTGLPTTTVRGYFAVSSGSKRGLLLHTAPSLTIEAQWNNADACQVDQRSDAAGNNFLPHLLPIDPTLHWANPPDGAAGSVQAGQPGTAH
jgi:hypothetical protein